MQKSKIYINTPANALAGGVEALFQLADAINNLGGNAILLWDIHLPNPIPDKYKHYNVKQSMNVEDISDNLIIFPEVWTEKIYDYKYIKKAIGNAHIVCIKKFSLLIINFSKVLNFRIIIFLFMDLEE